jgi:tellurite methyltransferase
VERVVVDFEADEVGDWVALLDCHHRQHVRHRPPLWPAPWVEEDRERARRIGTTLRCSMCDRCEIPAGLVVVRTTATWDEHTMPSGLRRAHKVATGRWGRLLVRSGRLRFVAATSPVTDVLVDAHRRQGIPPELEHRVEPQGSARFAIELLAPGT